MHQTPIGTHAEVVSPRRISFERNSPKMSNRLQFDSRQTASGKRDRRQFGSVQQRSASHLFAKGKLPARVVVTLKNGKKLEKEVLTVC